MADYWWNIKSDLNNIKPNNKESENFYHSSFVLEGFISVISLLNDSMKILVGLGIFNHVNFKDLQSDCY